MKLAGSNLMESSCLYGLQTEPTGQTLHSEISYIDVYTYIKIQILIRHEVQTACIVSTFPYSKVKEGSAASLSLCQS